MAQSVAFKHFPQIVWRNSRRQLWNPIHRQALKNRPEERVRLRIIEYLVHGGWSKHRISTEEAVVLPQREAKLRTDLICYTREFTPFLLVECKAERIKLSEQTAEQIARYNQRVDAPFLLMTNGRIDHWYKLTEKKYAKSIDRIPDALPDQTSPDTNFNYWQNRGFVGAKAAPNLRLWLNEALQLSFTDTTAQSIRHLTFQNSPSDVDLNHYYRIYSTARNHLAVTFLATEFGNSRLVGIYNRKGENKAVIEINLDLLFDDRTPNASVYWSGGTKNIAIRNYLNNIASPFEFETLARNIYNFFTEFIE